MAHIFSLSFITMLLVFQEKSCTTEAITLMNLIGAISDVMGIIDFTADKVEKLKDWLGKDVEENHQTIVQTFNNFFIYKQTQIVQKSIDNSVDDANDRLIIKLLLQDLSNEIYKIESYYNTMIEYKKLDSKKTVQETIIPWAKERIAEGPHGPLYNLNKIYSLFLRSEQNILKELTKTKQGFKNTCSTADSLESVQQMYLRVYNLVTMAAAKAYLIISTSVEMLRKYVPGSSYHVVIKLAQKQINRQQKEIVRQFKHVLKVSSREVWRCDPDRHLENKTFIELKNIFKKHAIKQYAFMESDRLCESSCKDFRNPVLDDGDCDFNVDKEFCKKMTSCKGKLWDCDNTFHLDATQELNICYKTDRSDRQFDYAEKRYINNADLIIDKYGHETTCTGLNERQLHVNMTKCKLCTCTCEENSSPNSDEFISLKPVFSNRKENRVVTGVRLVRLNHAIRIQIQEGTLGPMGTIVNQNVSWVSYPSYEIPRPTAHDVENHKVYKIQWNGRRQFTLGDIEADDGSVVVGLQFVMNPEHPEYGIALQMYTTPFDFETGKLLTPLGVKTTNASQGLSIENLGVPTDAPGKNVALEETNKIINLTTTGMAQDLGQTIVPFLDIQNVTTTVPTPMTGIGLYYKRYEGYGGFLGLKLFTYNFLKHFNYKFYKLRDLTKA